jgi:DNA-binding transcriptional MerR regulator
MENATDTLWTLHELGRQVEEALAANYPGARNGRIRAVPDSRTIRYYTTLGLIDRPAAMRGRTALYSQRHLHQLVAIKQLQARGLSLTEIQQVLTGLSEQDLAQLVPLPERSLTPSRTVASRATFWRAPLPEEEVEQTLEAGSSTLQISAGDAPSADIEPYMGLTLGPGVTLLMRGVSSPTAGDIRALQRAAVPLMHELRARGFFPKEGREV